MGGGGGKDNYSREAIILKFFFHQRGDEFSREAINRGTAII